MPTEIEIEMIRHEAARPGADLRRLARSYGLPLSTVRSIAEDEDLVAVLEHRLETKAEPTEYHITPLGRPELQKYIVAVRHVCDPDWPDTPELRKAKADYDAGLVEMAQGRDGDWFIQYSIPRKRPVKDRIPYFSFQLGDQ